MGEFWDILILTLDATLRVATPLILAALGGLFSERSGVIDIGLEGKMLAGAFTAGAVAFMTGSPWFGLLAAMGIGMAVSLLHGFACITHNGNQVVSGVAINTLAAGLTVTLGIYWFQSGGQTPALSDVARFRDINLPGAEILRDVPLLGSLYTEIFSGHNFLVYLAYFAVPFSWWLLFRTRFGLRLRAIGENPEAADTAGISVAKYRYLAQLCCGALCGISGSYLSVAHNASFVPGMTSGLGFMALAALIFGKWRPFLVLGACLLFGFLDAVAVRIQGVALPVLGEVSPQFIEAMPYILTVILLAGFMGKAVPPKSIGVPYIKER